MKVLTPILVGLLIGCATAPVISAEQSKARQYARLVLNYEKNALTGLSEDIGSGSAVVIAPGYALTAKHVASVTTDIRVGVDVDKMLKGKVVKLSDDVDLALIQVPGLQCPCADLADDVQIDDELTAIGYPLFPGNGVQFMTKGHVQGYNKNGMIGTINIAPGSSGGPVFVQRNGSYKLAGITVAVRNFQPDPFTSQLITWMTISVPVTEIRKFLIGTAAQK